MFKSKLVLGNDKNHSHLQIASQGGGPTEDLTNSY